MKVDKILTENVGSVSTSFSANSESFKKVKLVNNIIFVNHLYLFKDDKWIMSSGYYLTLSDFNGNSDIGLLLPAPP